MIRQRERFAPPLYHALRAKPQQKQKNKKIIDGDDGELFFRVDDVDSFFYIFIFISIYTRADIRYAHEF